MSKSDPALDAGFGSFFRYHGLLAPGIRLFRRLGFPAKAACISAALLIPLLTLLWSVWSYGQHSVQRVETQIDGIRYVKPALALLQAVEARREAVSQGRAPQTTPAEQAHSELQQRQLELGERFGLSELYKDMEQVWGKLAAAGQSATVEQHTAVIDSLLRLLNGANMGGELVLNSELDTNSVIAIATLRGPQQTAALTALRDMGYQALRAGQLSPEQRDALVQQKTLVAFVDNAVEAAYDHGIRPFPEVDRLIDMDGTDKSRDAFMSAVDSQLLDGERPTGDVAEFTRLANTAIKDNDRLMQQLMQRVDQRLAEILDNERHVMYASVGLAMACVLLAVYLMLSFYRVMLGGLQEVSGHLGQIHKGNLTTAPKPWGTDEAAQLMLTLRDMQGTLRRVVGVVLENSAGVQSASQEIALASTDLSKRTESNAASLEATAANMEHIAAIVQQTSDTVTQASQIVRDNAQAADAGGQAIAEVESTMRQIRQASGRIGDITNVIDSIAFQTNLLALNAAVEAARAGEQGRGFAVVAGEVRALAGRSAAAAREIKGLISSTVETVESGHDVVNTASSTIRTVVERAQEVDRMISDVAQTTQQQRAGVQQVLTALKDLDASTQQNAALVEESAAAASSLAVQAQRLATEVSFFQLR